MLLHANYKYFFTQTINTSSRNYKYFYMHAINILGKYLHKYYEQIKNTPIRGKTTAISLIDVLQILASHQRPLKSLGPSQHYHTEGFKEGSQTVDVSFSIWFLFSSFSNLCKIAWLRASKISIHTYIYIYIYMGIHIHICWACMLHGYFQASNEGFQFPYYQDIGVWVEPVSFTAKETFAPKSKG